MGLFDRLFGKKPAAPTPDLAGEGDDLPHANPQPIEGPPEVVRAVEMQLAYWTHNPEEQSQLEARGLGELGWRDLLLPVRCAIHLYKVPAAKGCSHVAQFNSLCVPLCPVTAGGFCW